MRFTEQMVGQRAGVIRLIQQRVLTLTRGAEELRLSVRQVRRLVRRLEAADGDLDVLGYQRRHPAPNRLGEEIEAAIRTIAEGHPRWAAPVVWEALESRGLSPLPAERTIRRYLRAWQRGRAAPSRPSPSRRFEAPGPLCLVQMDTTSGRWLSGNRTAHVIVILDDYSRAVLAARAVEADSTVNNLQVLEEAVSRYGAMEVLYSDNGSVFRTTRYPWSRFYSYSQELLAGEMPTQLARAVKELGAVPLTHSPGNARAKGKLERWNRFFQERVIRDGPYGSIPELDEVVQEWTDFYNQRHHHRGIGCTPATRLGGHRPRRLPVHARPLQDICALLETRKVNKDHSISIGGVSYVLPREPNLVAFTVEVRIRPGQTVRVWYQDRFIAELAHGDPTPLDGFTVDQMLERVLPRLAPKPPKPANRTPGKGGRTEVLDPKADILPVR